MNETIKKVSGILVGLAVSLIIVAGPVLAQENTEPKKGSEKPYNYEKSKYKAYHAFTGKKRTYRFDSKGKPIAPPKSSKKGKALPVPVPALKESSAPSPASPAAQPETETKSMPEAPVEQQ